MWALLWTYKIVVVGSVIVAAAAGEALWAAWVATDAVAVVVPGDVSLAYFHSGHMGGKEVERARESIHSC